MGLQLRKASFADRDLLFGWANDDTVRANAFHTEKIPYEKHVVWFEKVMADASVYQYILCDDGLPVGQIRLNVEGDAALVDYSVAADRRGKGYGSEMLRMLLSQLSTERIPRVTRIVGQVKHTNRASARAFENNGFFKREFPEYAQYEKNIL